MKSSLAHSEIRFSLDDLVSDSPSRPHSPIQSLSFVQKDTVEKELDSSIDEITKLLTFDLDVSFKKHAATKSTKEVRSLDLNWKSPVNSNGKRECIPKLSSTRFRPLYSQETPYRSPVLSSRMKISGETCLNVSKDEAKIPQDLLSIHQRSVSNFTLVKWTSLKDEKPSSSKERTLICSPPSKEKTNVQNSHDEKVVDSNVDNYVRNIEETLLDVEDPFKRLYNGNLKKKEYWNFLRRKREFDESVNNTYHPKISDASKAILDKKDKRLNFMQRQQEILKRRHKHFTSRNENKDERHSFSPTINQISKKMIRNYDNLLAWKSQKDDKINCMRDIKVSKDNQFSFHPQLSERSKKLMERKHNRRCNFNSTLFSYDTHQEKSIPSKGIGKDSRFSKESDLAGKEDPNHFLKVKSKNYEAPNRIWEELDLLLKAEDLSCIDTCGASGNAKVKAVRNDEFEGEQYPKPNSIRGHEQMIKYDQELRQQGFQEMSFQDFEAISPIVFRNPSPSILENQNLNAIPGIKKSTGTFVSSDPLISSISAPNALSRIEGLCEISENRTFCYEVESLNLKTDETLPYEPETVFQNRDMDRNQFLDHINKSPEIEVQTIIYSPRELNVSDLTLPDDLNLTLDAGYEKNCEPLLEEKTLLMDEVEFLQNQSSNVKKDDRKLKKNLFQLDPSARSEKLEYFISFLDKDLENITIDEIGC